MLKVEAYERLCRGTHVMGILNVTPDSFSDGGRFDDPDAAFHHARWLVEQGAAIVDVGGESTRPGAPALTLQEELDRTIPVVEKITRSLDCLVSIDTYKSSVAMEALSHGAHIVNDISAGTFDATMLDTAARYDAGIILMHIQGTPSTMQANPQYDNVVQDVKQFLQLRSEVAKKSGLSKIFVDPGFGFGKLVKHNYDLLRELRVLTAMGFPVVVGTSRKSFLGAPFQAPPEDRLEGTIVSNLFAASQGANILRVHDVKSMHRALTISRYIVEAVGDA